MEVLQTLKDLFPDNQVEFRNGNPTMWTEAELDSHSVLSVASLALQNKMDFTFKRSGKTIRTILK
jgi:hypothetical protein